MRGSLNILYLIDHLETTYPRDQNYIIRFMLEHGHHVEILTSADKRFCPYDSKFFPTAKILRCPTILQIKKAKVYFHPFIVSKFRKEYDIIHSFTFFTYSSALATLLRGKVKFIRSEIGPPYGLNFIKAKAKLSIYHTLTDMYRHFYGYYTAYNELEAKTLELLGFPKERIIVLPPMIDFEGFSTLRNDNEEDEVILGVIARISWEKGIHRLIPIMKQVIERTSSGIRKFRLILAGRSDNKHYAEMVISSLRNLLHGKFIYLGEVAPPYDFYKKVDVVIVPSLTETGAITVLEAMASGKCVVASNIYPINLYISQESTGFLFNTPSEAAKIILDILAGNVDIENISKAAQSYARKHDYRLVCAKLEDLYYYSVK